ncbi:hypothetical protein PLICRDRAFT_101040 [Plicaturopsis crispa FD-325 SS-3]|nr:hypothetical protein PLICRDRAFT_101040 [Plicaturopsis crispa FD-325 SS-3]
MASADDSDDLPSAPQRDALLVLLPLLIVLSTFLFLLLVFLVCVLLIRKRRGIVLRDSDGPVDMSREELIDGEGGFDGVESRWLESANETVRRSYLRAKEYQMQYPPNSLPTDITLSQFLSIQEKGVSAWSFEPDYETVNSLIVHARTEITFLPDPASSSCVQSNLPLPKLNEVYYWEVKMFDLPETTTVAVGLATKPYPPFRLPGLNRYSVGYHSNGDKSHNYPFTATPFGPSLKEGDVLGVGYRPRTGTVFFTRNGRKTDDAFIGLSRWNLFPTIGADGPCSVHVNLGQAGFVYIEANVKKWGLAPSVGTLAPPPAYGSERGSILLDVGGGLRSGSTPGTPGSSSPPPSRRTHRSRRPKRIPSTGVSASSPLRGNPLTAPESPRALSPPPPITPIDEEPPEVSGAGPSSARRYMSPTDLPFHTPRPTNLPMSPPQEQTELDAEADDGSEDSSSSSGPSRSPSPSSQEGAGTSSLFSTPRRPPPSFTHVARLSGSGSELTVQVHPPPDSPRSPNPPTPNQRDIHLQAFTSSGTVPADTLNPNAPPAMERRDPPAYSPLDAFTYSEGVHIDLPAEVIQAALEGTSMPSTAIGQANGSSRSDRRRSRRR